jgi:hypothetical protein
MLVVAAPAGAATMYSRKDSYKGAGTFYGPGKVPDSVLFDAQISNIGFSAPLNFVTPLSNNGAEQPNICGEQESGKTTRTSMPVPSI